MSTDEQRRHEDKTEYAKSEHVPFSDGPLYEYAPPQSSPGEPPPAVVPSSSVGDQPVSTPRRPDQPFGSGGQGPAAMPSGPGVPGGQPPPYGYPQYPPQSPYPPYPPQGHPRRLSGWMITAIILALVLVLGGSAFAWFATRPPVGLVDRATPATQPTEQSVPTSPPTVDPNMFEQTKCPFEVGSGIKEGENVRCGFVSVPENHDMPEGKKIRLAVAIFESSRAESDSLPMLYLAGGPGGSSLGDLGAYITKSNMNSLTLNHDFILLDQRGTGFSEPTLTCSEVEALEEETQDEVLDAQSERGRYVNALKQCRERLVTSGIDPTAYTTIQNAHDVNSLTQALGYKQLNLYGVSYGTRLAATVMRLHPQILRSVILDSTVPMQMNLYKSYADVTQNAYDTLFGGCNADPGCKSEHPELEKTFYELVKRLDGQPVTFNDEEYGPILMNGTSFSNFVFSALYVTSFIPQLPDIIAQVNEGEYTMLSQLYGTLMLRSDISLGMYYSVECGEDIVLSTLPELEQTTVKMREELRNGMLDELRTGVAVCEMWGQPPVPTEQKQPITSDIPTLILAGEYDPITPPSNGEIASQTLSKDYFYTFPATGHGVYLSHPCPNSIMLAFLKEPTSEPAAACVGRMEEAQFL